MNFKKAFIVSTSIEAVMGGAAGMFVYKYVKNLEEENKNLKEELESEKRTNERFARSIAKIRMERDKYKRKSEGLIK